MYVSVKLTYIVLVVGVALVMLCAWKLPRTVVPLTLGIAAAVALAAILHV